MRQALVTMSRDMHYDALAVGYEPALMRFVGVVNFPDDSSLTTVRVESDSIPPSLDGKHAAFDIVRVDENVGGEPIEKNYRVEWRAA